MTKGIITTSVGKENFNFDPKVWLGNKKLLLLYTFRVKLVSEVMLVALAEMVLV